ncbi:DUF6734 family protein [Arcicella sp. DC2W]|uniref:DUF6734 family protein n=1 Tax=Arcicella gelida TaxID=2984195 RepID=A0ABU5S3C9_9BACT|nr:DUF6734 family protein [Arcicella sp. DC2W]MEA5402905.1 DUF6734 family protein [Arcicella sp. DC2W]
MKIIHSFWSKPSLDKSIERFEDRKMGGWLDKKYNYMSWALSCLQFKKHYGFIELVTDNEGKKLFIDKLNLPYDSVRVELDIYNNYHPDLWAISKLHSYTLQNEPFLHVDGDVYIWKILDKVNNKPLIAQNEDIDFKYYTTVWNDIILNFEYIPTYMMSDYQREPSIHSCNAGIFGGSDVNFLKEFAFEAFEFLEKNKAHYDKVNLGSTVLIYEQYLFSCLARAKNKKVSFLFDSMTSSYDKITQFASIPNRRHYVHAVGNAKKKFVACENLANRLLFEYPDFYYNILALIEKNEI